MLAVNTKVNTDYIASSCWGLTFYLFVEKSVNFSVILSSKQKMNSTIVHVWNLLEFWK